MGEKKERKNKPCGLLNIWYCLLSEEKKSFQFVLSELGRSKKHMHMRACTPTHDNAIVLAFYFYVC